MSTDTVNAGETLAGFARRHGFTRQRAHALKRRGLPLLEDGSVNSDEADQWLENNLNRERRQGTKAEPGSWRDEKDKADAQLKQLELRRREAELIERHAAEKAVYERAQLERHAWEGWTPAAASALAAELDVAEASAFSILDRLVREHLERLSEESLETLYDRRNRG